MLSFFQKHEKITLSVVVFIVMLFFASSFFYGQSPYKESGSGSPTCAKAFDGSSVSRHELNIMKAFLRADSSDTDDLNRCNVFNSGVIRHDFILSGLAEKLFAKAPASVHESFSAQVASHRQFHPYKHPESPVISAELIWSIKAPKMGAELKKLASLESLSLGEQFATVANLYGYQHEFSPRLLAQYLTYLEQQQGVRRDPGLVHNSLMLFGAKDVVDWFGEGLLDQVCLFIHNVALLAEQEGHLLSLEEVKQDLMNEGLKVVKQQRNKNKELDVSAHWTRTLARLGLREKEALKCYKKVMLFRRKLAQEGVGALLNPSLLAGFDSEANKSVLTEEVAVAKDYRFQSLHDLLCYQLYCQTVYNDHTVFGWPKDPINSEILKQKAPEFIETSFEIEVSAIDFDELMTRIPLKEIKAAMLEESYYRELTKLFSFIPSSLPSAKERFLAIEAMRPEEKEQVYQWVKKELFNASFDKLIKGLDQKRSFVKEVVFVNGELVEPMTGIKDSGQAFFLFLQAMLYDQQKPAIDKYINGENVYTEDEKHYYQIVDCKQLTNEEVMSFDKMKKLGLISKLLDEQTKRFYEQEKLKGKAEYKDEQGAFLSFEKAKDALYLASWAPFLSAVAADAAPFIGADRDQELKAEHYPKLAFLPLLELAYKAYEQGSIESLVAESVLETDTHIFARTSSEAEAAHVLSMEPESLSEIKVSLNEFPSFFRVQSSQVDVGQGVARMQKGATLFKESAQQVFLDEFITKLADQEAFTIKREW